METREVKGYMIVALGIIFVCFILSLELAYRWGPVFMAIYLLIILIGMVFIDEPIGGKPKC